MGNSVVFPVPRAKTSAFWMEHRVKYFSKAKIEAERSYSVLKIFCYEDRKLTCKIPYLHFVDNTNTNRTRYLIIYFHGNSELLSDAYRTLELYHSIFEMDVLCAEYAGYGLYDSEKPNEQTILEDATLIIQHSIQNLKYKEENIILIGRSIGTGVAVQMAKIFTRLRGIILISPYLSVRDVAENLVGSLLARAVPDIFKSKDHIQSIKTPALFIHGAKDELIPCSSSKWLYENCTSSKMLHISPTMTHNKLSLKDDVFLPAIKFLVEKLGIRELTLLYLTEMEENIPSDLFLSTADGCPLVSQDLSKSLPVIKEKESLADIYKPIATKKELLIGMEQRDDDFE